MHKVLCERALELLPGAFCGGKRGPPGVPHPTLTWALMLTTPHGSGMQSWEPGGCTAPAMPRTWDPGYGR